MRTVISFTDTAIKAVQGNYNGKFFKIQASETVNMPKAAFRNAEIVKGSGEAIKRELENLRSRLVRFSSCDLVLDNQMYLTTSELPWLSGGGFRQAAKNAFMYNRSEFDERYYVTDYMILERPRSEIPSLVLFGALKKEAIMGIVEFLKESKIKVARIDMTISGLLQLAAKASTFDRKNAVICAMDGDNLYIYSFSNKGSIFTAQAPINEKAGTPPYFAKIAYEISKYASFKRTERIRQGFPQDGYIYFFDMNRKDADGNSDFTGYNNELGSRINIEDYISIGIKAALGEGTFIGNRFDADMYAPLLGVLSQS